jgi:metallo-beta-lactamase class B
MRHPFSIIGSSVIALVLLSQSATKAATPPAWSRPLPPFQIAGNTWYVGTEGLSVLLVRGEQGAVLIDAALPDTVPAILANLDTLGVPHDEIKLILSSHAHADHVGGLEQLRLATGARVLASAESAALMRAGGRGDLHFGDSVPYPPVQVDALISEDEPVVLGNLGFRALPTPGHTPGSTSWSWKEQVAGRELTLVYADSLTAPGYRLLDHPQRPQLMQEFQASFAAIRHLPCDILITPHPDASQLFERRGSDAEDGVTTDSDGCRAYADNAARNLERQAMKQNAERGD